MDISVNVHTDNNTTISRELPDANTLGGFITLKGDGYPNLTIFPPSNPHDAAYFWDYLSNVAADMATYCEIGA